MRIIAGSSSAIDKTDRAIDFLERDGGAGKLLRGQMDIRNKNRRLFRASRFRALVEKCSLRAVKSYIRAYRSGSPPGGFAPLFSEAAHLPAIPLPRSREGLSRILDFFLTSITHNRFYVSKPRASRSDPRSRIVCACIA